ncbi:MAG TPA: hypothetical protein VFG30_02840 [Polyangiales bacterium]|nr:hypothetical protein [Polyangiales bacterium]
MRNLLGFVLLVAVGCGGDDGPATANDAGETPNQTAGKGSGGDGSNQTAGKGGGGAGQTATAGKDAGKPATKLVVPEVYPLVRASTPSALIANPMYKPEPPKKPSDGGVGVLPQALGGEINLALAVQERFYMGGPTELLRIVKDLDGRLAGLDTDATKHACLTTTPAVHTYALPGGRTFDVKLQCMQSFGAAGSASDAWIAFGFGSSVGTSTEDAGADAADGGQDAEGDAFYLVEGMAGGMGGVYRISGGDVEAWIAVADSNVPTNSRVIMHLITHESPATSELALAGAGVGFCSAHLKTSADFVFIQGKTNAPPPPGTGMPAAGVQYCDALRAGCFDVTALGTDLGGDAEGCKAIAAKTFESRGALDASNDASANVMPDGIYMYFNQRPTGVADF